MEHPVLPKAAQRLVDLAHEHGWYVLVRHNTDTGGHPFVGIDVARSEPLWYFRFTWHTCGTGTYRLFSKIYRHVPLDGVGTYWLDAKSVQQACTTIQANPVQRGEK